MIIQTGLRTDIPAFFSTWFCNRIREGFVCVRNPYNTNCITRYKLTNDVVDLIVFCTKNPLPLLPHLDLLKSFGQYWYVTITPYNSKIEKNVPPFTEVIQSFKALSKAIGVDSVGWRYDPIFVNESYSIEHHIDFFETMAKELSPYTKTCVISFIDLYKKVQVNFPEATEVKSAERLQIGMAFCKIAAKYGITIKPCCEGEELAQYGADCRGCMTIETYEKALHAKLNVPKFSKTRKECACLLACDIGQYDTCSHFCRYCYANTNSSKVIENIKYHNPKSPLLIGELVNTDIVHNAIQHSWKSSQLELF